MPKGRGERNSVTGQASALLPRCSPPERSPRDSPLAPGRYEAGLCPSVPPHPRPPSAATHGEGAVRAGGRIFEGHAMRHLQRLPVLIRDEAGLDEEAVERPQPHRQRQQYRRPAGPPCEGKAVRRRPLRGLLPPPGSPPPRPAYRRPAARGGCTVPTAACGAAPPPASAPGPAPAARRPPPSAGAGIERRRTRHLRAAGTPPELPSGRSSEREASALWSAVLQVRGAGYVGRSASGAGSAELSASVPSPLSPPGSEGAVGERGAAAAPLA